MARQPRTFLARPRKGTQKKAAQVSRLLDEEVTLRCLSWQGGCGTRPGEMHTTHLTAGLEQSSPTLPCQAELLGETHGESNATATKTSAVAHESARQRSLLGSSVLPRPRHPPAMQAYAVCVESQTGLARSHQEVRRNSNSNSSPSKN